MSAAKILARITVDRVTGCWNYEGSRDRLGYGRILLGGKRLRTHRVVFAEMVKPIPDEMVLHHRCENPSCCNPQHLELTTQARHLRELTPGTAAKLNAEKTHCRKGHPLTPDNLETWGAKHGRRKCRICAREHERRYAARHQERVREARRKAQARHRAKRRQAQLSK